MGQSIPTSSIVGHFEGVPTLISQHTMGIVGDSVWLNHWKSAVMEKGGGACNNQHRDLGRASSHLQCPNVESVFLPHLFRKAGDNSLKLCSPVVYDPRGRRTEPVALFSQGSWGMGWLVLRQKTSFTGFSCCHAPWPESDPNNSGVHVGSNFAALIEQKS